MMGCLVIGHFVRASVTCKNVKNVKALVSKFSCHNEYSDYNKQQFVGLNTWSRCRVPSSDKRISSVVHLMFSVLLSLNIQDSAKGQSH